MNDIQSGKPGILFVIPPAFHELEKHRSVLDDAGYETYLAQYRTASVEASGETWDWIAAECKNLKAVIWPGYDFFDGWFFDEMNNEEFSVSAAVAKLVSLGAVELKVQYDYDDAFDDTVVIYESPTVFAQKIIHAIESHQVSVDAGENGNG